MLSCQHIFNINIIEIFYIVCTKFSKSSVDFILKTYLGLDAKFSINPTKKIKLFLMEKYLILLHFSIKM